MFTMYFCFVIFPCFFILICADELGCDLYQILDSRSLNIRYTYTINNYSVPKSRRSSFSVTNVSCPLDIEGNLCSRKCCLPGDSFSHDKKCRRSEFSTEEMVSEIGKILKSTNGTNKHLPSCVIYGSYCSSVIEPIDASKLPSEKNYCLDYFSDTKDYRMARCVEATDYIYVNGVPLIFTICLACSILFLLLTFTVYFSIQNLRNLPGKILLGYVASLLITDSFYVMLQTTLITEGTWCVSSGYIIQFSFLASFYWLNVMCFDLWWTFSGYRGFSGLHREKDHKKFIMYSLYAWGCPALIASVTLIVDNIDVIPQHIKPKLARENNCWFGDDTGLFFYFYSFVSVLLVSNFFMFLHTTIIIIKHNKSQDKLLNGNGSRRHFLDTEKKRFYVYLKLFSIMGINWLMEIMAFFYQNEEEGIIWDIIDICNMLQGTFIFIIFVCKRRVILLLNKKIYPKKIFLKETWRMTSVGSVHYSSNVSSILQKESSKSSLLKTEISSVSSTPTAENKRIDDFVVK